MLKPVIRFELKVKCNRWIAERVGTPQLARPARAPFMTSAHAQHAVAGPARCISGLVTFVQVRQRARVPRQPLCRAGAALWGWVDGHTPPPPPSRRPPPAAR